MKQNSTDTATPPFVDGYRSWLLAVLLLVSSFNYTDRIVFAIMSQSIKQELGLTDLQLGLLGGLAFALVYTGFGIPVARLADRYSRTKIIAAAILVWSLMTAFCGLAANFWQLLIGRVGVGVGEAGFLPPTASLLGDTFPPNRRASAMAIVQLGSPISALAGGVLLAWVGQELGWRMAFVVVGLPGIIISLVVYFGLREPQRGLIDGLAKPPPTVPLGQALREIVSKPAMIHVVLAGALAMFGLNSIGLFLTPFFVRVHGFNLANAGVVFGIVQFIGAVSGLLLGGFGTDALASKDLRWRAWGPAIGLLCAMVAYGSGFTQGDSMPSAGLILLGSACLFVYFVPSLALVQNMSGPHSRATAVAVYALVSSIIGTGLGPTLVGLASDLYANAAFHGGSYTALCPGGLPGADVSAAVAAACRSAAATGVQRALITCTLVFPWAAIHYLLAARTLRRDLYNAAPAA